MKNSLELELQLKIKRANRFLGSKQYSAAIQQYTEGLRLYSENRTYNQTVSEQFQSLLYSLRGHCYSLNYQSQNAENDFNKSLVINPYNSTTLGRRAKHLMKQKRFSQAIQDIDLALLYDPENSTYIALLNSIEKLQVQGDQNKDHLLSLVEQVKKRINAKPPNQSSSESEDDQDIINFSKLKKIDRVSIKITPNSIRTKRNKSVIEFKEDQIMVYENQNQKDQNGINIQTEYLIKFNSQKQIMQKLKEQEEQLNSLQNEEENNNTQNQNQLLKESEKIILKKNPQRSRKSILRKSIVTNASGANSIFINKAKSSTYSQRASISAASIKNIDGKLISQEKQAIKFRPSISNFSIDILNLNKIMNDEKQNDGCNKGQNSNFFGSELKVSTISLGGSRKSCLRSASKRFEEQISELSKTVSIKRKSSFLNIKNIDGDYKKKSQFAEPEQQKQVTTQKSQRSNDQSDDDQAQHNIFGNTLASKKKQKEFMKFLEQQMGGQSSSIETGQYSSKKSILRKNSVLGGNNLWKSQSKKSVLFRTG